MAKAFVKVKSVPHKRDQVKAVSRVERDAPQPPNSPPPPPRDIASLLSTSGSRCQSLLQLELAVSGLTDRPVNSFAFFKMDTGRRGLSPLVNVRIGVRYSSYIFCMNTN